MLSIYKYTDYRFFLKDYYQTQKESNPKFSYRFFARLGGLSSSAYLKVVMEGQRNLSPSAIHKFTKAMKLSKKESDYFEALVFFNQAKTEADKDIYFERLLSLKPKTQFEGIEKDKYEYYTQKHFVIIREMVALPHFKEDPEWIAKVLRFRINPSQAKHALDVLLRLNLISRDETGKLKQTVTSITTTPEVDSLEIFNFHRSMLREASDSMLKVPHQQRDFSSLTLAVPKTELPKIKTFLHKTKEDLMDMVENSKDKPSEVFQLNIQLFPATKSQE